MAGAESQYGDLYAADYDEWYPPSPDNDAMLDFLIARSGEGVVVELGVGTGRVAGQLVHTGQTVIGADSSPLMLDALREKHPAVVPVETQMHRLDESDAKIYFGRVSLCICVFNTFFMVDDAEAQLQTLRSISDLLSSDGQLVLDLFVPDETRYAGAGELRLKGVGREGSVLLHAARYDRETQLILAADIVMKGSATRVIPMTLRPVDPAGLDRMAAAAGLRLEERYADWLMTPFDASSSRHISVYSKG